MHFVSFFPYWFSSLGLVVVNTLLLLIMFISYFSLRPSPVLPFIFLLYLTILPHALPGDC
jgi:hypothetical protein